MFPLLRQYRASICTGAVALSGAGILLRNRRNQEWARKVTKLKKQVKPIPRDLDELLVVARKLRQVDCPHWRHLHSWVRFDAWVCTGKTSPTHELEQAADEIVKKIEKQMKENLKRATDHWVDQNRDDIVVPESTKEVKHVKDYVEEVGLAAQFTVPTDRLQKAFNAATALEIPQEREAGWGKEVLAVGVCCFGVALMRDLKLLDRLPIGSASSMWGLRSARG